LLITKEHLHFGYLKNKKIQRVSHLKRFFESVLTIYIKNVVKRNNSKFIIFQTNKFFRIGYNFRKKKIVSFEVYIVRKEPHIIYRAYVSCQNSVLDNIHFV